MVTDAHSAKEIAEIVAKATKLASSDEPVLAEAPVATEPKKRAGRKKKEEE